MKFLLILEAIPYIFHSLCNQFYFRYKFENAILRQIPWRMTKN